MFQSKYLERFEQPEISVENLIDSRKGQKVIIDTSRFTAKSIISAAKNYEELSEPLKQLYKVTFGDTDVVKTFGTGNVHTTESYFNRVELQSQRWINDYPFAAFIMRHKDTDDVVGYMVIGNGFKDNTPIDHSGEVSYLIAKRFQNSGYQENSTIGQQNFQHVGTECVGGLILGYGQKLYEESKMINQVFSKTSEKFEGGTVFNQVLGTAKVDNPGSIKIMQNLGFEIKSTSELYGSERYTLVKDYNSIEISDSSSKLVGDSIINDSSIE
jgi:RimJ/RimL family protein N-acetyltransferase